MKTKVAAGLIAAVVLFPGTAQAGGFSLRLGIGGRGFGPSLGVRGPIIRHRRVCVPRRVWVPGHYVERVVYVHVPGRWEVRWFRPVVRHVSRCGCIRTVVVVPGRYERVWIPPRRVPKVERVYVPGHWR